MGLVLKTNVTVDSITGLEILPCPFCGGKAHLEELEGGVGEARFSVGCYEDEDGNCYGYQSLTSFARRSDAIIAWNKRPK